MNQLYQCVGISKQAVYQNARREKVFLDKLNQLILEVDELRKDHPGCGVEKMYRTLKPDFIGRDRFVELFMDLGYRVKRIKNYHRTTIASKLYYSNLINGLRLTSPSQVWQSDITYIQVKDRFYYAVFIVDVFTRKIVGYNVSDNMRAESNVKALKMALKCHQPPQIHHSDRGSQYTYKPYVELLKEKGCKISMGLCAQDNAYAERINGTIKNEYLKYWKIESLNQLKCKVRKAVNNYNNKRVHQSINYQPPGIYEEEIKTGKQKGKEETIFDNESII